MRVIDCIQGSPEWHAARCGKITASRMTDVMTNGKKKGEPSKVRQGYLMELVSERLTGIPEDTYNGYWTEKGKENEPFARAAYENLFDVLVDQVGFVLHPTMDFAGCSPDGLVGDDGLIQIKCPKTTTHLRYMQANTIPSEYQDQCTWELACTGRKWLDFVSYDPRLPEDLQLWAVRLMRCQEDIDYLESNVSVFEDYVQKTMEALRHGRK